MSRPAAIGEHHKNAASRSDRGGPGQMDAAAPFPASMTSDREQPSSAAVMNSGLAQRLVKCRCYVQR